MVTREATRTPKSATPDYDWRKEPWVNDETVRALSYYIAFHVITAMAATGDDKQDEEDERVCALLNPRETERVWKSAVANEVVNVRLSAAAAQGIDELISKWMDRFGAIDAKGPPSRLH